MRGGMIKLRDFIDKTSEQSGTPINRDYLMAIQGFDAVETIINDDRIVETNSLGETRTITFEGDSIIETFDGERRIQKTITFDDDCNVMEVIS